MMAVDAEFLIPYLAFAIAIAVVWSLACLMYDAALTRRSPLVTWLVGIAVIVLPVAIYNIAVSLHRI